MKYKKNYNTEEFKTLYKYDGNLGAIYSKEKTKFILWAPTATLVKLYFFREKGYKETINMNREKYGVWSIEIKGDLDEVYYNYLVTIDDMENEVVDPYAKEVGVNGTIGMVVDLKSTNPKNWDKHFRPILESPTDSIIYETHIRDFSIDEFSGINSELKGKYQGMCQPNTKLINTNIKTGIDHIKDLGINVVHLLPCFDYKSVNESNIDNQEYNWGYDPQNYNVPEGSYSTNPYNPKVRIKEFKEMIMKFHECGIKVVMDVVYNHTAETDNFDNIVPGYYYRQDRYGNLSNASQCGNETASERYMVRRFIIDSVCYWAKEYKIDGFRFDLMGIHDIETMKEIRNRLNEINSNILIYGEGWKAGESPIDAEKLALKQNILKFNKLQIAAFSDDIRDGVKGAVFEKYNKGFVNGSLGLEETIKFGIVAATKHEDIDYSKVIYSNKPWANEPYQTINYVSSHDNYTLWDKLQLTNGIDNEENKIAMNKLAAAIVLTSQGIPFMQAGEELLRTKERADGSFEDNSYKSPDSINKIDWKRKEKYYNVFEYYKGLIKLRKSHIAFRMKSTEDIKNNIVFLKKNENFYDDNVVAYMINSKAVRDKWDNIIVIFNANNKDIKINLPNNRWKIVVNKDFAGTKELNNIEGNSLIVEAISTCVLVK